ncbi:uncharacterized protein N7443_000358 [Penicillium atrosanguineum]|uniref:Defective in cullin neddylation protein n=1 Tax=Penicillium atrosanguineum TaxID=1132637 RepID=A0A9W9QGN2_9EURO|nr:uncharacterized protein N7443_000358 [Penicillium atrosanguineum]KAJ5313474.1 hypothetical protein N7443_000358 [Penicillium atrosanguineum]KAJ5330652.1 hypothetical protein N7476_000435 [Penicillium atrosanguineum]
MPAYTAAQKDAIDQFVDLTNSQRTIASKYLKQVAWNVERAVDSFFGSDSSRGAAKSSLSTIFDKYRDDPQDSPDGIGIDGAMTFLNTIEVQLDEVACLAVLEMCQSPSMGEFTRDGFIDGWKNAHCDNEDRMKEYIKYLRKQIPNDPNLFRRVYRFTFPLSRMQGQRNLQYEIAADQWKLFFTSDHGGMLWNTARTPWLDWWLEFLEGRGKKPVNKDLWEQVEVFMRKSLEDEEFGWWSPDGAWPGALDEFVDYVKERRGKGSEMDVE